MGMVKMDALLFTTSERFICLPRATFFHAERYFFLFCLRIEIFDFIRANDDNTRILTFNESKTKFYSSANTKL